MNDTDPDNKSKDDKKSNVIKSNQTSKGTSLSSSLNLNLNPHDSVFLNNISYLSQVFICSFLRINSFYLNY